MALHGTRVSSRLSDERVPEYTPATLLNWVSPKSSCRHARARAEELATANPTSIIPSFVERISRFIHHQGPTDAKTMCQQLFSRTSFFLVETTSPLPAVALATACNDDATTVRIHHPSAGVADVHVSSLNTIHEFTVAYSDDEALNNLHRQQGLPAAVDFTSEDLSTAVIPMNFTTNWKQCDPRWGKDMMEDRTVCQAACLVTSVTTALYRHGIRFRFKGSKTLHDPNPGTMNHWLRENGGYTPGSNLIHSAVAGVCASGAPQTCSAKFAADGMHKTNDLSMATLKKYLRSYRTMAANVHNGGHWVLAFATDTKYPDRVYVKDSAGSTGRSWYSMKNDIVGWRIYDIRGPHTPKSLGDETYISSDDVDMEELARQLGL